MVKHWEHTEFVTREEFESFSKLGNILVTTADIPANTGVFVQCNEGSKRLEGVYDPRKRGIRPLLGDEPNRDLRLYGDSIQNEHITILAVDGLMGTGKTSSIIEHLIKKHLLKTNTKPWVKNKEDSYDAKPAGVGDHKILIAKPYVNAGGEEYGFLPGDLDEKMDPTLSNFIQYFDRWHPDGFKHLRDKKYIQILPLGFIRGLDATNMTIVVDEAQNTKELVTVVTRRAKDSRIVLLGDTSPFQIDVAGNTPTKNGLSDVIDLLKGAPYFQYIEMKSLEHIVRSDEVKDVVRRLFKKYGENPLEWKV